MKSMKDSIKHIVKVQNQPGHQDNQTLSHTNFRFDEEAAEWQALITKNSYEEMIFLNQDMPQLQNFGTVDNPHLIYTSEVPFRFVACTGPPSEDDFEYHEVMWMLLRNGPLQRCGGCGQVFKLVILRDEFSVENDYYTTGQTEQEFDFIGESDVCQTTSLFRPFMFFTGDHTHFETKSNYVYSLMRMDDHDRYLTDPAFRMEQNQLIEEKNLHMANTINNIDASFKKNFGQKMITNLSRDQYENIIETEKSIEMLNRHFERMQKFQMRAMLDPLNHTRRQNRMEERMATRKDNLTFYLGDVDEAFLQYKDYFETDCEVDPVDPKQDLKNAESKILSSPYKSLKNYDFNEVYTTAREPDAMGLIQREIFRYKYRQAQDDEAEFERKENARLAKRAEWMASGRLDQAINKFLELENLMKENNNVVTQNNKIEESKLAYKEVIDLEIELALLNYESYFADDEPEFVAGVNMGTKAQQIRELSNVEKIQLLEISDLDLDKMKHDMVMTFSKEKCTGQNYGFVAYLLETFSLVEDIERHTSILKGHQKESLKHLTEYRSFVSNLKTLQESKSEVEEGEDYVEKLLKKHNVE
jgi:hypothetical protein